MWALGVRVDVFRGWGEEVVRVSSPIGRLHGWRFRGLVSDIA